MQAQGLARTAGEERFPGLQIHGAPDDNVDVLVTYREGLQAGKVRRAGARRAEHVGIDAVRMGSRDERTGGRP